LSPTARTVVEKVPVYDYIIVGAGSAGCVLAARLSENPATRVLLLEAGPPDDADEIHIPAALNLLFQSTYDWDFRTVPQERAAGRPPLVGGRRLPAPGQLAAQPDGPGRCPGDPGRGGGGPRRRGALPAARDGGDGARRGRGDPGRRGHRQPASAHAVRHRPRR